MKALILIISLLMINAPFFAQSKDRTREPMVIEICKPECHKGCERINGNAGCPRDNPVDIKSEGSKPESFPANEHGSDRGSSGNQSSSGNQATTGNSQGGAQNSQGKPSSIQQPGKTEQQRCLTAQELQKLGEEGDLCGGDEPLDSKTSSLPTSEAYGLTAEMLGLDTKHKTQLSVQELLSKYYERTTPNKSETSSSVVNLASEVLSNASLSKDVCLNAKQFRSQYRKHFASDVILNLRALAFLKTKMLVTQHPDLIYVNCVFRSKDHPKEVAKKLKNPNYVLGSGPHPQRIGVDVRPGMKVFGEKANRRKDDPNYKNYDPKKTQEIVNAIRRIDPNAELYFNDPQIIGVKFSKDHDNHIHITWSSKPICLTRQALSNK